MLGDTIWHAFLDMSWIGSTAPEVTQTGFWSHTKLSKMPATIKGSVLLRDTIVTWKAVRKAFSLPFLLSKHMPIWGHPETSFENNLPHNAVFQDRGVQTVAHLVCPEEKRWYTSVEVLQKYALPSHCHFKIMQILAFCRSRLRDLTEERENNKSDECLAFQPGYYGLTGGP